MSEVQLLATSPPYNVGIDYDGYDDNLAWPDWYGMMATFLEAAKAALRPGGILALNVPLTANRGELVNRTGRWRERRNTSRGQPVFARLTLMVQDAGFLLREPLIWVKSPRAGEAYAPGTGIGSDNNPYLRMAAEAFVLASKDHYHMPGGTGRRGGKWARPMDWCKNVWHLPAGWQDPHRDNRHPAPWSWALCSRLILMFTNEGDRVCDPFMGSAKLLLMAKRLKRSAVGVEISEGYCRLAAERLSQAVLDIDMSD